MEAGKLDRRIDLQRSQPSQAASGQLLESWGTFATVWASVTAVRGDEPFAPPQYVAKKLAEFRIRWSNDVSSLTPKDRLIWPAGSSHPRSVFNIIAVTQLGRHEGLRIIAQRRDDV